MTLGRGNPFHIPESISVPDLRLPSSNPRGRFMLLRVKITQLALSLLTRSWARMWVYSINSMCRSCKSRVSEFPDSLFTRMRNGIGSLQVRIGGFGSLASADTVGGSSAAGSLDVCSRRERRLLLDVAFSLANSCRRRAKVSSLGL
jgi:hypothetical protein